MFITSFKRSSDLYNLKNNPSSSTSGRPSSTCASLQRDALLRWLGNTAFAGLCVVTITLLLAVPAAYALTRLTGRWGRHVGIGIFLTYLVPHPALHSAVANRGGPGPAGHLWSIILVYLPSRSPSRPGS
jgi:multiple sugar transport system permease protein